MHTSCSAVVNRRSVYRVYSLFHVPRLLICKPYSPKYVFYTKMHAAAVSKAVSVKHLSKDDVCFSTCSFMASCHSFQAIKTLTHTHTYAGPLITCLTHADTRPLSSPGDDTSTGVFLLCLNILKTFVFCTAPFVDVLRYVGSPNGW